MAGPRERQQLQLTDLDDKILVQVFGFLPLEERLSTVELVCRRFRELSRNAPQLHLTAAVLPHYLESGLVRVRSLAEWLVKRGGTVSSLDMRLSFSIRSQDSLAEGDGLDPVSKDTDAGDQIEPMTEALLAVAHCAARGALQDLRLSFEFLPAFRFSAATAAALANLRSLHVEVSSSRVGLLVVVGPLHAMTALRELALRAEPLHLKPGLRLPPGLTRLALESGIDHELVNLPEQLSSLTALRDLSLGSMRAPAEEYSVLAPLTGLQRLKLAWCTLPEPALLAELAGLQALALDNTPHPDHVGTVEEREAGVAAALAVLQHQLTEVQLEIMGHPCPAAWPPVLAACTRLRHLALTGEPGQAALPPGDWLGGLRRLMVPNNTAAASLLALQAAAPRLEVLGIGGMTGDEPAFVPLPVCPYAFAAAHPRLQRLVLNLGLLGNAGVPAAARQHAVEARQRKPGFGVLWAPTDYWAAAIVMGGDAALARFQRTFRGTQHVVIM